MTTPWVDALTLPASDEALRKKVCVSPVERPDLDKLPIGTAVESLVPALEAFYSVSQQDLDLIREIVGCGAARALLTHSSTDQFVASAHGRRPTVDYPAIRLLTGHAGVGKSHLLKAIERGLHTERMVRASTNLPAFPIIPAVYCEVGTLSSKIAVLQHLLDRLEGRDNPEQSVPPPGGKLPALAKRLSVSLYQRGTVLGLADELQFNTRSSKATALTAQIIAQVASLGSTLFFACNYSLVHKLKKRPPEDRNRFLSKPKVMLPLLPDDPAFSQYFTDAGVVLCGAIAGLSQKDLGELHGMTFGLRRMMASLVVATYAIARQERDKTRSRLTITMAHFRAGYRSCLYSDERNTVASSFAAALGNLDDEDYVCPFDLTPEQSVVMQRLADARQQQALNAAVNHSSRTKEEREEKAKAPRPAATRAAARPKSKRVKAPSTANELLAGW